MRCKKHYTDLSSNVGVCASCLRERLFPLVIAHEHAHAQTLDEQNHNSETHPVFPRSVSPYKSSQHNSDRNHHHSLPDKLFFSTPQVAPVTGSYNSCTKKKQSFIRFSLLSNLFRSKKRNADSNPNPNPNPRSSVCDSNHRGSRGGDDTATSATSSPFRFSHIRSSGGCRNKQPFCFNDASTGVTRKQYCSDRGMSPVRYSDCEGAEDEIFDRSSGYETCESRKQTPWRTPAHRRGVGGGLGGGDRQNVSVMSFCLSPLVRASPCRNRNQKGVVPVDYGEIGASVKAHRCKTESFCGNRSRKVADFGRVATNR